MNQKLRQESIFVLVIIFFLFFLINIVSAINLPSLPTIIKGTSTINEMPTPVGTMITAKIDNIILGEENTTQEGQYLIAVGGEISNTGKQIELYINNMHMKNTNVTWASGSMNTQDLAVTTKNNNYLYAIIAALVCFITFFMFRKKK